MMKGLQLLFAAFVLAANLNAHAFAYSAPQGNEAYVAARDCATLYQQRKFNEAVTRCTEAARLNPDEFRIHAILGLAHMGAMKFKSASDSFAKAIKLQPQDKELYLLKATADRWRNAMNEAVAGARKALEIDPNFARAHQLIGEVLQHDEKRRNEAIAAYRAAIKADPQLLEAHAGLGSVLANAKDEKGAEEVFKQAMAADPQRMAGRFELGRMLVKQGRLAEARELWEGRKNDTDNTFPNFISLLERAENLKRATDALAKTPEDPETLVAMGLAVMEGDSWVVDGRQERAIVYFKKALGIRPDFAKAQYAICKAYVQVADTFDDKKPLLDAEIVKLRQLDPKLADEIEAYRKNYSGGIRATPSNVDQ
jgi:tetratricopeptide (TPR) repeat protein